MSLHNKYHVAPKEQRIFNGVTYQSKKEKDYAAKLEILKSAKNYADRVLDVQRQVKYPLSVNGVHICNYFLDFKVIYHDREEYVDVKGYKKGIAYRMFEMKKQLMLAIYHIKIIEK